MNNCIEKQRAIENSELYYFTGKPCKRQHVALRRVADSRCLECGKEQAAKYRNACRDKINKRAKQARQSDLSFFRERERKYFHQSPERHRKSGLKYRKKNRVKATHKAKQHYYANHEHCKQIRRHYAQNNRGRLNALEAKRHAQKLQATPKWANYEKIVKIYEECKRLTDKTGIKYNVDHIIPLQSNAVCGLHCEYNLQILTKQENLKKSNIHEQL